MSWRVAAILAVGGALGCSRGGGTISTCELADLCAQVAVERVNATCGRGTQSSSYVSYPRFTATASDTCTYYGTQGGFTIYRDCFQLQRDALVAYLGQHNTAPSADVVTEEVAGVGDIAFFRYSNQTPEKNLVILSGNDVITLSDTQFADPASDKACMTELAGDAVAAR